MIRTVHGDILQAPAAAVANPVNCVGVAGRGLALQFRRARPDNHRAYVAACRAGLVRPGRPHVHLPPRPGLPVIVNVPTKRHWRDASRLDDVAAGIRALADLARAHRWATLAVPPLGCGLGALPWSRVERLIHGAFADAAVDVLVYAAAAPGEPRREDRAPAAARLQQPPSHTTERSRR